MSFLRQLTTGVVARHSQALRLTPATNCELMCRCARAWTTSRTISVLNLVNAKIRSFFVTKRAAFRAHQTQHRCFVATPNDGGVDWIF